MPYKDKDQRKKHNKEYGHNWYQAHKDKVMERRKKRQVEIRDWFRRYKSSLKCMDCSISHPAALQFHHRERHEKSFNIADVTNRASSIRQIVDEIEKCDVVCVNCHAKRHWLERHEDDKDCRKAGERT